MPIRFVCTACEKTLKVDDRFAGRRAKCPNCGSAIEIPATPALVAAESSGTTARRGRARSEETSRRSRAADRESEPVALTTPEPIGLEAAEAPNPDATGAAAPPLDSSAPGASIAEPTPPVESKPSEVAAAPAPEEAAISVPAPPPFELDAEAPGVPSEPPVPPSTAQNPGLFVSPFEIYEDDAAEIVYAEGIERAEAERFLVSRSRISLPRAFVYLQGAALVAVGALCFFLGWAFGGAGGATATIHEPGPVVVDGVVRVERSDDPLASAEGALVALLPSDGKPPEKLPIEGLRPAEVSRVVPPRTLSAIREFGGALAVTDSRGSFRAELPRRGEYDVLVVLPEVYRPSGSKVALDDLAKLGDYFVLPDQLVGDCRYSLKRERFVRDRRLTVDVP